MRNLIKFNKSRCKVLLLGQGSPRCEYRLGQEVTRTALQRRTGIKRGV